MIDTDLTPKPIAFLRFVIVKGIIKGNGVDEDGEFDINGIEKEGDCKFNKNYTDLKVERYFGILKQEGNESKIIGNYLKNDKKGKFEMSNNIQKAYSSS